MSENKSFDELLLPVRNDIDRIDKELLKLFTERMQCAERVAEIKRKAGIPVLNAARVVRFRADKTIFIVVKCVVIFAATHTGNIKARAELHAFDGGDAV